MLDKLFSELFSDLLARKRDYLNAATGEEFENRVQARLVQGLGFTALLKQDIAPDIFQAIKVHILGNQSGDFMPQPAGIAARSFVRGPYGSQNFPDFLIFTGGYVVPVEIKFSKGKQPRPVWNSNVPKANAFYVFGSYGRMDLTIFCGRDVLAKEHRRALYQFFEKLRPQQNQFNKEIAALDETRRGFRVYVRAAFEQAKLTDKTEASWFSHPDRQKTEKKATALAAEL